MRGKFITIEGQDGAGKSTNIAVVRRYLTQSVLQQRPIELVQTREPGGTPFGESIRELLLNSGDDLIGDQAELLLIFAARSQHIKQVILPALNKGNWVLSDRFTDATYAYQGGGRGLLDSDIARLENHVQGDLRPDLTLLLDLPVELGESRAGQRSETDRFEQQQQLFKKKVRESYLDRANRYPDRIKLIDASQSMANVEKQVVAVLSDFVNGQFKQLGR